MNYQFIEQHKQEFPVIVMYRVRCASRKVACTPGASALPVRVNARDAQLTQEIHQVVDRHQGRYGSPRIYREIKDQGRKISW